MLQCVQYHKDGSLRATDSYIALRINNFHTLEKSLLQNIFTMEFVEEQDRKYPDTDHIFDKTDAKNKLIFSLGVLKRVIQVVNDKDQFHNLIVFNLSDGDSAVITNGPRSEIPIKVEVKCHYEGKPMQIAFNVSYLKKMVDFMIDANPRYAKDDVIVFIRNDMTSVVCELEDEKYQFIVTPVITN